MDRSQQLQLKVRAAILSALVLLLILGLWHVATLKPAASGATGSSASMTAEQIEYAKLMGKSIDSPKKTDGFPTLEQMAQTFVKHFA
ncbi:MAG: nitrate ABC transporter, permease protein, partial [Betaproteobacteria bacterium]|nr:nitrate ABC transporter, permease protein [Betaproteobacteria bacterium]NCW26486.1 nitrate ABC transporter, permease protein [Betaproteobacteria bacterium]